MKIKRLIALGLSSSLALAMTVPAFAASQTTITATYTEIPISVVVPKTATAMINPYGMPYEIKNDADETIATISGQQITTAPAAIINKSSVDLNVGAIAETTAEGVTLSTEKLTDGETAKKAYMYLELADTKLAEADIKDDVVDQTKLATAVAGWNTSSDKQLVLDTEKSVATKDNEPLITLKGTTGGKVVSGGVAMLRLAGKVVKNPEDPWAKTDKVVTNVTFTFTPDSTTPSTPSTPSGGDGA